MTSPKTETQGGATDSRSSFHNMDYLAHGGVTFPKNRSSDVSIVGHKFGDDSPADPKPLQQTSRAREQRRKVQKGKLLSNCEMGKQIS